MKKDRRTKNQLAVGVVVAAWVVQSIVKRTRIDNGVGESDVWILLECVCGEVAGRWLSLMPDLLSSWPVDCGCGKGVVVESTAVDSPTSQQPASQPVDKRPVGRPTSGQFKSAITASIDVELVAGLAEYAKQNKLGSMSEAVNQALRDWWNGQQAKRAFETEVGR